MGGYIGRGQPVAAGNDSVETTDIVDDAITNDKIADDAVGIAELSATGDASATTFLRGDNAWEDPLSDSIKGFAIAMSVAL